MRRASYANAVWMALIISVALHAQVPGELRWAFLTGGPVEKSSPALGTNGAVFIGSQDGKVYALSGANGAKLWEFNTGSGGQTSYIDSSPSTALDGTVFIGSAQTGYGKLYALDGKTGAKKWEKQWEGWVSTTPAIGLDQKIYVATSRRLYRFDASGGVATSTWVFYGESSSPVLDHLGNIHIGCEDQKLYSTAIPSMPLPSNFSVRGWIKAPPAIGTDGTLYFGTESGYFYAYEPLKQKLLWEAKYSRFSYSPAIAADGTVYAVSANSLYAFAPQNGEVKWSKLFSADLASPAVGSDGVLYAGSPDDDRLYAIDGQTGKTLWFFQANDAILSCPTITSDGTVVFGSRDRKVYAVWCTSKGLANSSWPKYAGDEANTGRARAIRGLSPRLEYEYSGDRLKLRWPVGFSLEATDDFRKSWATVAGSPVVIGELQELEVLIFGTRMYFRLKG